MYASAPVPLQSLVGSFVGFSVGSFVGFSVGSFVAVSDGEDVWTGVGRAVVGPWVIGLRVEVGPRVVGTAVGTHSTCR